MTNTQTLSCTNCHHYKSETWGDGFIDQRVTEEFCKKHQWEFEEPSPSPVTSCTMFEFAIADPEYPINFDIEEVFPMNSYPITEDIYVLYKAKIYHCSEVTTEGELFGADCQYGSGDTLFLLDELEGGQYVSANDCLQVSPNFFLYLRFWAFENIWLKLLDLRNKIKDLIPHKCPEIPFEEF